MKVLPITFPCSARSAHMFTAGIDVDSRDGWTMGVGLERKLVYKHFLCLKVPNHNIKRL